MSPFDKNEIFPKTIVLKPGPTWTGVHKSGIHTAANFYGAYDFNKDNKVVFATEFFDVGGMMNAVQKK